MKIDIKHRFTNSVLFSHDCENNTIKITVESAVKAGADLTGADLTDAELSWADLTGAHLSGANFTGAILDGADLSGADLSGADFTGAILDGVELFGADLSWSDLICADLSGAYLAGANLTGANLDGETITKTPIQVSTNIWPVLITEGYMRIGCLRYSHTEWKNFTDDEIGAMDSKALDFWHDWKTNMLNLCTQHKG